MPERIGWLDTLRGLAIILMVAFHFCYDLRYFAYVSWDVPNGPYWWQLRYLILSLFIFTMGVSLSLAYAQGFVFKKFIRRTAQLLLGASVISVGSTELFPDSWIYFGILHFLVVASIVGVVFVSRPRLALALGGMILASYWCGLLDKNWPFMYIEQWLPNDTEDFVPLIPWLGVMLFGVGLRAVIPLKSSAQYVHPIMDFVGSIGRHGLFIYLIHQPLLFAGFACVAWLLAQ